jgi:hypothetical protein
MNTQRVLLTVFTILVMIAGTLWFLNTFELKESEEQIGFRGEAKTNSLYAARLFLKRMGVPAERKDSLSTLPNTDTVLVIDTQRYTLSRQKIDEILAWVKQGGHLITRARVPEDSTGLYGKNHDENDDDKPSAKVDLLQTALGIRTGEHVLPEDDDLPITAKLSGMGDTLEVDPQFFYALETDKKDKTYPQKYKKATWLLEKDWGEGLVTLAANLDFIENQAIDDYDHAEFFWQMVHARYDEPTSVWLVHQDDMPPLWKLIWKHAWALVLTLAMLIPLTLLALSPRFGPMIPKPQPGRRRILEHIHASGLFMWKRHKQGDTQYQGFADSVEQLSPSTRKTHDKQQPDA